MQLNHLHYFFVVATEGSFTLAAKRLRIGQPTISKTVQQLEAGLGLKLLERTKRGVVLTPAGREVMERARVVFEQVSSISELAKQREVEPKGDFWIAANEHVAAYLLPPVIAEMRRRMPRIVPRILTGPAHLLLPEIIRGKVELGLFFKVEKDPRVQIRVIRKEPCCIVVAPAYRRDRRVLTSFIGSREIDDLGNRAFPTLTYLRKKRPQTTITVSCNSLQAHKELVLAGCGISILPRFIVERELEAGELAVIHEGYSYDAELSFVSRANGAVLPAARWLLGALERR